MKVQKLLASESIRSSAAPFDYSRIGLSLLIIALAYFTAARVGLLFVLQPEGLAGIWPASGVALAAVILSTRGEKARLRIGATLAVIFMVNGLSNLTAGGSLITSLGFAFANALEPALGAFVFLQVSSAGRRTAVDPGTTPITFERIEDVLALMAAAASTVGPALIGALVPSLAFGAAYWQVWQVWWVEDGLGILLFTPAVLAIFTGEYTFISWPARRWIETSLLLLGTGLGSWFLFGEQAFSKPLALRPYFLFPLLFWAAMRFPVKEVSFALVILAAVALGCTTAGVGAFPLGGDAAGERLVFVQLYLLVTSLTGLLLAAIFSERRKTNQSLARAQQMAHLGSWENYLPTGELRWSDEMYQIMGFPPGKPVQLAEAVRCFSPQELERFQQALNAAVTEKKPYCEDYRITRPDGNVRYIHDEGTVVYDASGKATWMYGTTLDITQRKLAEEALQAQLERINALRTIDQAIAASQDLDITARTILAQVTSQLKVDAASILLYEPGKGSFRYTYGAGFSTAKSGKRPPSLGKTQAQSVAINRKKVLHNPPPPGSPLYSDPAWKEEGFSAYVGLPLITQSEVIGVLEIYHRSWLAPDFEWLDYLDILAGQAAIAVEKIQMFNHLQHANWDLELAYDTTIEGWSRALDLRDKETEGHSQRVTALTIRLALAMGMGEDKIVHIYRGALLHDIGKMGVPDHILLKPAGLDEEEWKKMRLHPQLAYDLLSPIPYLRSALDIPYCHHEKWDGSGYPRGLKGSEIPFTARIFAVVDVWDALTSDRPYRPAWTREKAIAHIRAQSGNHFDPKVVEAFLELEEMKSHNSV